MKSKVIHISVRADMGGGPRHIQYLLEVIKEKVDCYVACPDDDPFYQVFCSMLGQDKVIVIPHRKVSAESVKAVRAFVKKHGITLVHCHGKGASVYGKVLKVTNPGTKVVYTPHGIHISEYSRLVKAVYIGYEKLTAFLFDRIIYVSESESELAKSVGLFRRRPSVVVPNGVPDKSSSRSYDVAASKRQVFGSDSGPTVLTFSRFDFQKNMSEALAIAARLPQYNFLWLGYGDDFDALKEKAEAQQISNVFMLGARNDVGEYLAMGDVYLSTSRWEGMPLSLLEAMSYGIPIVASDVTGNRDVVSSQSGFLYPLGNIETAAGDIQKILENKQVSRDDVKEHFTRNYSSDTMAGKVLTIYKEISL
ncbi:MAG: glycosyltransferase [Siphonobacter aquaeclarae]|nr:glycosyltransferase [Siphonobacter aquaeclarae]